MEPQNDDHPLRLTKFDVAERQLLQAVRMFFSLQDEVSIHTLSEAAAQVFYDIGKSQGVKSLFRDSERIRPEYMKEWLAAVFQSRNFFKHADKDAEQVHEFKSAFNDFSLLDAVNMHCALKKRWTPETLLFVVWFGLRYPHLVKEESDLSGVIEKLRSREYPSEPTDKKFFERALLALRSGALTMPNITLVYGSGNDA